MHLETVGVGVNNLIDANQHWIGQCHNLHAGIEEMPETREACREGPMADYRQGQRFELAKMDHKNRDRSGEKGTALIKVEMLTKLP
jgi:hypothetical protein